MKYVLAFIYGMVFRTILSYFMYHGRGGWLYYLMDYGYLGKGIITFDFQLIAESFAHLFLL